MKYFNSEINRRVLAITLIPAGLVAVLLTLTSSIEQTSALEKSLSERGLAIVRQFAPACEYGVYSANEEILRPLVESVMKEPNVVRVVVYDAKGRVLIRSGGEAFDSAVADLPISTPGVSKLDQRNNWRFYSPIFQSEFVIADFSTTTTEKDPMPESTLRFTDRVLGWVSVEISLDELKSIQTRTWVNTIVIAATVLLVGGLLAFRMGKSITSPVTKLMRAVNEVEKGHLDIQINSGASGELKFLENGINKMAKALRESHDELETKIDKATEDLQIVLDELANNNAEMELARHEAERANRQKSTFVANISHEIRTPLHGVQGFMELLSETNLQEDQQAYVDRINSSLAVLSSLLNDILDFSRLEVSKLKLEYREFSAFSLLDGVVNIYALEANKKGLELISVIDETVPEYLHGCADRISQVLRNLASNAIKFTSRGEITMRIERLTKVDESLYRFSVTDTGIGIPPMERDRLFQPFSQLESGTQKNYGGVGLGLVISKALVELMGGQIFVNSIEGVGSCFSVELPLRSCDPSLNKQALKVTDITQGISYWIISPGASIQNSLQQAFLKRGGTVLVGNSLPLTMDELPGSIRSVAEKTLLIIDGLLGSDGIVRFLQLLQQLPTTQQVVPVLLETTDRCAGHERLFRAFGHRLSRPLTYLELESLVLKVSDPSSTIRQGRSPSNMFVHPIELDQRPKKVLLVDDNIINREFLNIWMVKAGIDVDEAINGSEAFEACTKRRYDLILMDLHMPEMDGFQALKAIRSTQNKNTHCRVIAITADATEETITQINASGFDDFLTKPVTRERLLEIFRGNRTDPEEDVAAIDSENAPEGECSNVADEELGIRYASGNKTLWHWSLKTLAQRLPQYQRELQQAVEKREYETLSEVLHTILGAATYCCATDLISSIKQLQKKIKQDSNTEFENEYSELLESIAALIQWVNKQVPG